MPQHACWFRVFVPRTGARPVTEWDCPEQLELSSIACGLVLGDSIRPCTNEVHKCAPLPNCECGAAEQTADHVLIACSIHRAPHGARGLTVWITKLDAGLTTSLPTSDPGSTAAWVSKRINPWHHSCLCLTWSGCPFKRRRRP